MVTSAEAARRRAKGLPRLTEKQRAAKAAYNARKQAELVAKKIAFNNEEKLRRGCADCGYRGHPAALDWDHLPGFEKSAEVGSLVRYGWGGMERLLAEMAKCEVVCANCHRIRSEQRRPPEA